MFWKRKSYFFAGLIFSFLLVSFFGQYAQASSKNWTIVITTSNAETAWNAMRLAVFSKKQGKDVSVFLLGEGVKAAKIDKDNFDVSDMMETFVDAGGKIYVCGLCLRIHKLSPTKTCPIGTMKVLFDLIENGDKILIF